MNKKLLILAFVLLAGLTVSAQQIERVGRNVPGRGPGFQLPPLPEHVVLSLRDTSARTFEGRSSNNAPLFFIYPDAALDSVSAAALVSELGLPDIVRDFHASVYVINPSEGKYDDAADFDAFVWMFNRSRPGNLKVVGIGDGASFVNRVLLPRAAGHIAGILSIDGKTGRAAKDGSDGVPAYIAGKKELVELAAERLTAPGEGKEVGPSLGITKSFLQILYLNYILHYLMHYILFHMVCHMLLFLYYFFLYLY